MKALLIRHAASSGQAADAPLSEDGYAQARDLIAVLSAQGAGPLYASPFRRAQETIAPFAEASGQQVTVIDALRERLLSTETLPDWQDHIRRSFSDASHVAPGGESHLDLCARASTAFQQITEKGGALPTFVTHGGMTAALFHAVDARFGFEGWQTLRNPDVFAVTIAENQIKTFTRIEMEHQG